MKCRGREKGDGGRRGEGREREADVREGGKERKGAIGKEDVRWKDRVLTILSYFALVNFNISINLLHE